MDCVYLVANEGNWYHTLCILHRALQIYTLKSNRDALILAATCAREYLPICKDLSHHELEHKKTDTLDSWVTIFYYTRIFPIQAIREKGFDKLVNLSFVLSKSL